MDTVKKLWPHALRTKDVKSLVITIILYIVANFVLGLVLGLLAAIPLLGFIFSILSWVVSIYCLVGIVLAVLNYFKLLK